MNKKKIIICAVSLFAVIALLFGGSAVYLSDYYRADVDAIEAFAESDNVIRTEVADGALRRPSLFWRQVRLISLSWVP